eukprot:5882956-Amphidinium_carterae.1
MPEANGELANQEETLGEEPGDDAMAVEEARKRIHTQLDAGEDPLTPTAEREGHEVIERLHLRPAAKASRETPEVGFLGTETPPGDTRAQQPVPARDGSLGGTGRPPLPQKPTHRTNCNRPGNRPGKHTFGNKLFPLILFVCLWRTIAPARSYTSFDRSWTEHGGLQALALLTL